MFEILRHIVLGDSLRIAFACCMPEGNQRESAVTTVTVR